MPSEFSDDFGWQERWLSHVMAILAPLGTVSVASDQQDAEEATDLLVEADSRVLRAACRLRKPGYAKGFRYDVTVTCRRETGHVCEWHKMIDGDWGDLFFYGHAPRLRPGPDLKLGPWYLIDLRVAREWMRLHPGPERGPNRDTHGQRCWFFAYDVRDLVRGVGSLALLRSVPTIGAGRALRLRGFEDGCDVAWVQTSTKVLFIFARHAEALSVARSGVPHPVRQVVAEWAGVEPFYVRIERDDTGTWNDTYGFDVPSIDTPAWWKKALIDWEAPARDIGASAFGLTYDTDGQVIEP